MRHIKPILFFAIATCAISCAMLWIAYQNTGRTPRELMDYTERRLQGHPRIETVALPITAALRAWLDEPSLGERSARPFVIPPPPRLLSVAQENQITTPQETPLTGRVLRVGPSEAFRTIYSAAQLAQDGDTIEIKSGEYHADVALWRQKQLTIRGVGGNARLFADGKSAEGKAIWVFRNGRFLVENIDFIGARVADRNGAGIRFEGGKMRIRNCLFYGNESGIAASNSKNAALEIENSEFGYNGAGDGQSHNLYVGKILDLRVTGSYFHHANVGHLIKTRADNNYIAYNRLTDESGGRASYELDIPNGGSSLVIGNIIQQSRETENSTVINYGEEGYTWPSNHLYLVSNTVVNDHPYGGAFLRVAPGARKIISMNNLLIGEGKYHVPNIMESTNDIYADWEIFNQPQRQDYRLNDIGRKLAIQLQRDGASLNRDFYPKREYIHPRQTRPLVGPPEYPGALQRGKP